jgi:hypothetical protein
MWKWSASPARLALPWLYARPFVIRPRRAVGPLQSKAAWALTRARHILGARTPIQVSGPAWVSSASRGLAKDQATTLYAVLAKGVLGDGSQAVNRYLMPKYHVSQVVGTSISVERRYQPKGSCPQ